MAQTERQSVLIIDDTPENIQVLLAALHDEYIVMAANNGYKGIELAQSDTPPDLILLDVMMPGLDGYEVCQRLKSEKKTKNIPVIFVTALRENEDEEKGLKLGAIDYLTKPIKPALVKARVKNHIELHRLQVEREEQINALQVAAKLREEVERITQHDIKGPLGVILGYPQLLEMEGNLNPQQRAALSEITTAGQRILDMVESSLELYTLEAGSYQYKPERINLLSMVQGVASECSVFAKQYSVVIFYNPDLFNCNVWGKEQLCHTMLTNLLKNAIEASSSGGQVTISLHNDGDYCVIDIKNAGVVPMAIRDNFFDKFSTSGKSGGTGLGTYSAKMCAEIQQGSISLQTDELKGTVVSVRLKRADVL